MHDKHQKYQNRDNEHRTPIEESVVESVDVPEESFTAEAETPMFEMPNKEVGGVVIDCAKLNIRKQPNKDAVVVTVIPVNSEVIIDLENSTEDFYKVCSVIGIEGYCMKQYIEIR